MHPCHQVAPYCRLQASVFRTNVGSRLGVRPAGLRHRQVVSRSLLPLRATEKRTASAWRIHPDGFDAGVRGAPPSEHLAQQVRVMGYSPPTRTGLWRACPLTGWLCRARASRSHREAHRCLPQRCLDASTSRQRCPWSAAGLASMNQTEPCDAGRFARRIPSFMARTESTDFFASALGPCIRLIR